MFDCIGSGACTFVRPSHIPLVQYYRYTKGEIRTERLAQQKSEIARQRYEDRNERLARIEAERKAAREARAKAKAEADVLRAEKEAQQPATMTAPAAAEVNIDDLERKVLAQKDRVIKAQNSYESAKSANLDTVDILFNVFEKQQKKLQLLEQELNAI